MKTYDTVCLSSVKKVMEIFGGKWAFLILEALHQGPMRFGELQKELEISTKSLSDVLKHLEKNEIIHREVYPTTPIKVEYSLTEKGTSFDSVLIEMKKWGTAN